MRQSTPRRDRPTSPTQQAAGRAAASELFFAANRDWAEGRLAAAEAALRRAIGIAPALAEAHANLALLLDQTGRRGEAEEYYRRALALQPQDGQTRLNLAVMLAAQKRFDEAFAAYAEAIRLLPDSPAAWSNLGVLQACCKDEAQAERSYRRAIAIDPGYRNAHFNLSYLLLRQGRYDEGWRCLEARDWYAPLERLLACPRWRGEPLAGKSILIGVEAGHGDMIQFCRYAPLLKELGAARVGLLCQPALTRLFASVDGVDRVFPIDQPLPLLGWDCWTPPFSIAFYCQTRVETIPATIPYLRAERACVAHWASVLADRCAAGELRVGLVWKGSPSFENDAERSLAALDLLAPLGSVDRVRYLSLQKGAGEEQAAQPPAGLPLVNLGGRLRDFADTAGLIENLDLVISVDSAVAHLSGALGKACWLLLPDYKTDWRWLTQRDDSPWYPGVMRLFRQPRMGDWASVVAELGRALRALAPP